MFMMLMIWSYETKGMETEIMEMVNKKTKKGIMYIPGHKKTRRCLREMRK